MKVMTEELTKELIRLLLNNDKDLYNKLNENNPPFLTVDSNDLEDTQIKNNQLIFLQDKNRIAYDLNDERHFYDAILLIENESNRQLEENLKTGFYYVLDTSCLWYYDGDWKQITNGTVDPVELEKPVTGKEKTVYIDTENKNISVWDSSSSEYICVGNYTESLSNTDIDGIFVEKE